MKLNSLSIKTFVVSAAAFLAGCGGGGGSSGWTGSTPSGPPASKLAFPIEATMTSVLTSSSSKTLRYTDAQGVVYSIDYSSVPGGDTTFNGKAAKTAAVTAVLKINGAAVATSFQTTYFQIGPLKLLGYLKGDGKYGIADNQVVLPTTATVGSTGKFYSTTEYTSNLSSIVKSSTVATWSLEADTATTAYLCENDVTTDNVANAQSESTSECYKIDSTGKVISMRLTMNVDGKKLIFTGN